TPWRRLDWDWLARSRTAKAPPVRAGTLMNSRRLIAAPTAQDRALIIQTSTLEASDVRPADVRFGSKADICGATSHVRFTPDSDRESGLPQTVMSALPPKADICSAATHVCFGPQADMRRYSITSSARLSSDCGTVRPRVFAVFWLITNSYLVGLSTARSAGLAPCSILST